MFLLHVPLPAPIALIGLGIIILGMFLHSYYTKLLNTRALKGQTKI